MRQLKMTKKIMDRQSTSLEKYLREINQEELITADEEVILAKKIRDGDKVALDKLTKANLRFVVSVAKQYQNQGLSLPDLINEGNFGLIKAAKRFDETRGFKFISYAVWWIRQSILQALAEQSRIVRLPLNKQGSINKINKVFPKLEQEYEREPSAGEIALELQISEYDVKESKRIEDRHVSMDAPFHSGGSEFKDHHDSIHSDSNTESGLLHESLQRDIKRSLDTLPENESKVLKLFFLQSKTQNEVAEIMGILPESVRQLKDKAIRHLKKPEKSNLLKQHLG